MIYKTKALRYSTIVACAFDLIARKERHFSCHAIFEAAQLLFTKRGWTFGYADCYRLSNLHHLYWLFCKTENLQTVSNPDFSRYWFYTRQDRLKALKLFYKRLKSNEGGSNVPVVDGFVLGTSIFYP